MKTNRIMPSVLAYQRLSLKQSALSTASAMAISFAAISMAPTGVHAQAPPQAAQAPSVEEIVVTGTRIIRDGYEAPTPLTVVGIEELQNKSPLNIVDALNEM